jgi:UDP:flavonoid glycosyltransferase YjiC (YdhE family)
VSRTALFFPWGAGGGAAYTGRCLVLAARLRDAGWRCLFGPDSAAAMVEQTGFRRIGPEQVPAGDGPRHPYLAFANVERVYAVTARLYRDGLLSANVQRDRELIEDAAPDVVVYDMQPSAAIAARGLAIPTLSLADTDFLDRSEHAWMPWLTLAPDALLPYPSCMPAIEAASRAAGIDPPDSVADLLWGDLTVVPSAAHVEPPVAPPAGRAPHVYAGPMYWDPPSAGPLSAPARPGRKRVYVSVGSGGMISREMLQAVLDALDDGRLDVFVSLGSHPPEGIRLPGNAVAGGFTGLTAPLRWCDVAVTHGGASTVIASLAAGVPQVVVPLMSEHEANGRSMVEGLGAGLLVRKTDVDPGAGRLRYVNRSSGSSTDPLPRSVDFADAVRDVLGDPSYAAAAEHAGASLREAAARFRPEALTEELAAR